MVYDFTASMQEATFEDSSTLLPQDLAPMLSDREALNAALLPLASSASSVHTNVFHAGLYFI